MKGQIVGQVPKRKRARSADVEPEDTEDQYDLAEGTTGASSSKKA